MTKILIHPLNQPSPLLLIHCIASVGKLRNKYIPRSLNLIFHQANVACVGKLVKVKIQNLQSLLVLPQ